MSTVCQCVIGSIFLLGIISSVSLFVAWCWPGATLVYCADGLVQSKYGGGSSECLCPSTMSPLLANVLFAEVSLSKSLNPCWLWGPAAVAECSLWPQRRGTAAYTIWVFEHEAPYTFSMIFNSGNVRAKSGHSYQTKLTDSGDVSRCLTIKQWPITHLNWRPLIPHQTLSAYVCFGSNPKTECSSTHMWRRSQEGWSQCLTWLCFPVWSTRYIHPRLHEFCLFFLPSSAPLLWYLLRAHLSQQWISWASLWFWYYWRVYGLRSACYVLSATPLRQRRLLWWLRITSMPSMPTATSMHWTGLRTSRSLLR